VVCAVVGALVALPALRLSGLYLALATAAFAVFLDRWVFVFRAFDLGPWRIKFWEGGVVAVQPVDIPGIDTTDRQTQLIVLACVTALAYLLVVTVRRSGFGQRLLAMKDSPAACATLGIDITRVKLSVFALSAAMAGVGGALYAGTLGSVSAERFGLFQSLPLLLLTVVGGIGTAVGPLFAGLVIGAFPILIAAWPWLGNLNRVLPGTMGVALGRNPNGAVRDIGDRYVVLGEVPAALAGLVVSMAVVVALAVARAITGWGLVFGAAGALVVWPQVAEAVVRRRAPSVERPLERAGIDWMLTPDDVREIDAALGLGADPEEAALAR
jgi:branched-chain amino acid transport system permease protein